MKKLYLISCSILIWVHCTGQSPSFETFMNPVIPGDHPDPTLTKIGDDFYTSGSSFNPTPVIYHSTDLVHWEAVSQPVSASWELYGDEPGSGIWGGHMVYHLDSAWHFFGKNNGTMYFVKAGTPEGPWSDPTEVICPSEVPGLGQDNSIFIDDDNRWYLLVKNGRSSNWIVELGEDGQPAGDIHDLSWLNPEPDYPYSWAEGPVMWKLNGYYYYSFAHDLAGGQYIMRSDTLCGEQLEWTTPEDFFTPISNSGSINFRDPNHCSPVIWLDDSTSWVVYHAYSKGNSAEWMGQGRQGMLSKVNYDDEDMPLANYPSNSQMIAPDLPSSGIPWMVPKSDFFNDETLNPEWSFLGYTPDDKHSLTERPGWLRLYPKDNETSIVKNDAEHNYSLITHLSFGADTAGDEAGFWVFNGLQTLIVRLISTVDSTGNKTIKFSFDDISYETENTAGDDLWLKLFRENHILYGYFSADSLNWIRVGDSIDVSDMDTDQPDYNAFTGNRQGLYVKGKQADFNLYIYRDAYTEILGDCPANQFGTKRINRLGTAALDLIHTNDWALYAGIEFGDDSNYVKTPVSFGVIASSETTGGTIEVWLDSIDTGEKVSECSIESTGDWDYYKVFTSEMDTVKGRHDVYLKFIGTTEDALFRLERIKFLVEGDSLPAPPPPDVEGLSDLKSTQHCILNQNHPNPFSSSTAISFEVPYNMYVSLKVYNLLGEEVADIAGREFNPGTHSLTFKPSGLRSGTYLYTIKTKNFSETKQMLFLKE